MRRLVSVAFIAGCSTERDEVPGNVRPGSIEEVTREVDGYGRGSAEGMSQGSAEGQQLREIGVIPVTGNVKPVIPLITPPEVILFYVFPRKSRDGLSWRNGVWIARVTKTFSWGVDEAMNQDRLKLSSLTNMRLDEHGQLVVDQEKSLEPNPHDIDAMRDMASQLPWRPSNGPSTRTTIVYPAAGQSVSTTTAGGSSPYIAPNGAVNLQEVQRAMQDAQQRLRESQNQRNQASATGTANPTSVPPASSSSGSASASASPSPSPAGASPVGSSPGSP
jgi:hypothetical protein